MLMETEETFDASERALYGRRRHWNMLKPLQENPIECMHENEAIPFGIYKSTGQSCNIWDGLDI